jgi:hypothetical protein
VSRVDVLSQSAPPMVWLQVDTSGNNDKRDEPIQRENWGDLTWCYESIGGQEVRYVREDMVAELIAAARAVLGDTPPAGQPGHVDFALAIQQLRTAVARIGSAP